MIKITVGREAAREMKGTGKTSGREYHFRVQRAYAHLVGRDGQLTEFPEAFSLNTDPAEGPYAPGEYVLSPSGLYVRDEKLVLNVRLQPLKKAAA